ncbi:MAG TPA: flagellar assembly peptidoglycan hydrolase FlgJ, partial [Reyranella sp.]|nr:flagellar assembly peptidoglycan hydrolase FlgJ [Reyranella sp.]
MQTASVNTGITSSLTANRKPATPTYSGHPDYDLMKALQKVSPQAQAKAHKTATDFEGMFLNQMFSQMTAGLQGDGPFGNTAGTGVWRS